MSSVYDRDLQCKLLSIDENATTLRDLMKEWKVNVVKWQELQRLYYNNHVNKRSYELGEFVQLHTKYIKAKQNPKLEYKYMDP